MNTPRAVHEDELDLILGFERSPFTGSASSIVTLEFAEGFLLAAHQAILQRCAKLASLLNQSPTYISLNSHSSIAGHALVEYLYTGRYKLPRWTGPIRAALNKRRLVLRANFEAYALARSLELRDMEDQIKLAIERKARHLDVFTVIDVVKQTYPVIMGKDTWFPQWIESQIRNAFEEPAKLTSVIARPDFRDDSSVVKLMFRCMVNSYVEMRQCLVSTSDTDSSFGEISDDQLEASDEEPDNSNEGPDNDDEELDSNNEEPDNDDSSEHGEGIWPDNGSEPGCEATETAMEKDNPPTDQLPLEREPSNGGELWTDDAVSDSEYTPEQSPTAGDWSHQP